MSNKIFRFLSKNTFLCNLKSREIFLASVFNSFPSSRKYWIKLRGRSNYVFSTEAWEASEEMQFDSQLKDWKLFMLQVQVTQTLLAFIRASEGFLALHN